MFHATREKLKTFIVWMMMLNDTPHSIAMGVAVGFFVALTPTVGIQMVLIALVSLFIRCNRTSGLPMAWVTNPFTMVPIFYFNYRIGSLLLQIEPAHLRDFEKIVEGAFRYEAWYQRLYATILALGRLSLRQAGPLWLGSVVVGLAGAVPLYFIVRKIVTVHRVRHQRRLEEELTREAAEAPVETSEEESAEEKSGEESNGEAA